MTPTPIPEDFGIATIRLLRNGADAPDVTTFGYNVVHGQTASDDASDLADAWIGAFTAASTLNSYTFTGVHVLRNIGGDLEAGDNARSNAGTVNAQASSPAVAVRVTKRTALAGVKFRGRMFLPPAYLSEANVDAAGVIDGATLSSLQTKCDALLTALNSIGTVDQGMMLLHADSTPPTHVDTLVVRSSVGTQRRRQALL